MNQRRIGMAVLITSIILSIFIVLARQREEVYIQHISLETGSCILDSGVCLHNQILPIYIIGWSLAGALLLFGIYLSFFDKTQKSIADNQVKIAKALESAKQSEKDKDEFKAFISGFTSEEQSLLKSIKEEEGITQSTLRFKTGLTKTDVSLLLASLEKRGIICRTPSGKTKQVFLVKKF